MEIGQMAAIQVTAVPAGPVAAPVVSEVITETEAASFASLFAGLSEQPQPVQRKGAAQPVAAAPTVEPTPTQAVAPDPLQSGISAVVPGITLSLPAVEGKPVDAHPVRLADSDRQATLPDPATQEVSLSMSGAQLAPAMQHAGRMPVSTKPLENSPDGVPAPQRIPAGNGEGEKTATTAPPLRAESFPVATDFPAASSEPTAPVVRGAAEPPEIPQQTQTAVPDQPVLHAAPEGPRGTQEVSPAPHAAPMQHIAAPADTAQLPAAPAHAVAPNRAIPSPAAAKAPVTTEPVAGRPVFSNQASPWAGISPKGDAATPRITQETPSVMAAQAVPAAIAPIAGAQDRVAAIPTQNAPLSREHATTDAPGTTSPVKAEGLGKQQPPAAAEPVAEPAALAGKEVQTPGSLESFSSLPIDQQPGDDTPELPVPPPTEIRVVEQTPARMAPAVAVPVQPADVSGEVPRRQTSTERADLPPMQEAVSPDMDRTPARQVVAAEPGERIRAAAPLKQDLPVQFAATAPLQPAPRVDGGKNPAVPAGTEGTTAVHAVSDSMAVVVEGSARIEHRTSSVVPANTDAAIGGERWDVAEAPATTDVAARTEASVVAEIPVKPEIRVKAEAPVEAETPVTVEAPVKAESRVKVEVPVRAEIQVKTETVVEAGATVKAEAIVKAETTINAETPVQARIQVTTKSPVAAVPVLQTASLFSDEGQPVNREMVAPPQAAVAPASAPPVRTVSPVEENRGPVSRAVVTDTPPVKARSWVKAEMPVKVEAGQLVPAPVRAEAAVPIEISPLGVPAEAKSVAQVVSVSGTPAPLGEPVRTDASAATGRATAPLAIEDRIAPQRPSFGNDTAEATPVVEVAATPAPAMQQAIHIESGSAEALPAVTVVESPGVGRVETPVHEEMPTHTVASPETATPVKRDPAVAGETAPTKVVGMVASEDATAEAEAGHVNEKTAPSVADAVPAKTETHAESVPVAEFRSTGRPGIAAPLAATVRPERGVDPQAMAAPEGAAQPTPLPDPGREPMAVAKADTEQMTPAASLIGNPQPGVGTRISAEEPSLPAAPPRSAAVRRAPEALAPVRLQQLLETYSQMPRNAAPALNREVSATAGASTPTALQPLVSPAPLLTLDPAETPAPPAAPAKPESPAPVAVARQETPARASLPVAEGIAPASAPLIRPDIPELPAEPVHRTVAAGTPHQQVSTPVFPGTAPDPGGKQQQNQPLSVTPDRGGQRAETLLPAAVGPVVASTAGDEESLPERTLPDPAVAGQPAHPALAPHAPGQQKPDFTTVTASDAPRRDDPATVREHVTRQLVERLERHEYKPATEQIVFRLTPENLGELKINLRMESQRLSVEIVTENRLVTEGLRQNSDTLKESLAKQNIRMDSFDVTTGGEANQQHSGRQARNMNEWQELARQRQANQWQTGGYAVKPKPMPEKLAYIPQPQYTMLDLHF